MQFSVNDIEMVSNLKKSIKILTYLETKGIRVNYECRDGLYYLRKNGLSPAANRALGFSAKEREEPFFNNNLDFKINFYCNVPIANISSISESKHLIIGTKRTDIFILNQDQILYSELVKILEEFRV
jgi:hypothetical protein